MGPPSIVGVERCGYLCQIRLTRLPFRAGLEFARPIDLNLLVFLQIGSRKAWITTTSPTKSRPLIPDKRPPVVIIAPESTMIEAIIARRSRFGGL